MSCKALNIFSMTQRCSSHIKGEACVSLKAAAEVKHSAVESAETAQTAQAVQVSLILTSNRPFKLH